MTKIIIFLSLNIQVDLLKKVDQGYNCTTDVIKDSELETISIVIPAESLQILVEVPVDSRMPGM